MFISGVMNTGNVLKINIVYVQLYVLSVHYFIYSSKSAEYLPLQKNIGKRLAFWKDIVMVKGTSNVRSVTVS